MITKKQVKSIIAVLTIASVAWGTSAFAAPFGGIEMKIENGRLQNQLNSAEQDEKWNVWGQYFGGKLDQDFGNPTNKFFPAGLKSNYNGIQAGLDRKVGSNFRVGAFAGYTDFDGEFKNNRGDLNTYSSYVGVYGVYQKPENGLYANAAVRVGSMKNELDMEISARTNNTDVMIPLKASDDSHNWSVSFGAGKRFFVNDKTNKREGFYIEPQAGVLFGRVSGTEYKDEYDNPLIAALNRRAEITAEFDGKDIGYLNVGTLVGYEVKKGKNPLNVYGKVGMVYDFGDDHSLDGDLSFYNRTTNARLSASPSGTVATSMNNHWWVFGLGVKTKVNERHSLQLDLETTAGGDTDKHWQLSAGYKYSW